MYPICRGELKKGMEYAMNAISLCSHDSDIVILFRMYIEAEAHLKLKDIAQM